MKKILVTDDEKNIRDLIRDILMDSAPGAFAIDLAVDGKDAFKKAKSEDYDLIISDLKMPAMDGLSLLRVLRENDIHTTLVMITAHGSVESAVEAMKLGAYDYISKPLDDEKIIEITGKALRHAEASSRDSFAGDGYRKTSTFRNLIGKSPAMKTVFGMIDKLSRTDSTVLIQGETGTGKELVARAIHENSARGGKPFVALNCAVLNENLLESELFGHEKGAFTGAIERRLGKFEVADCGTLFLDEVAEMSNGIQAKLLRVLQENEFERVGGVKTIRVDVRVLAASHVPLKKAVDEKKFRDDLYYRLNVIELPLPPLRERVEDVPLIADYFLKLFNERFGKKIEGFSDNVMAVFEQQNWPGNIRELQNVIERAVVLTNHAVIGPLDLPEYLIGTATTDAESSEHETGVDTQLPLKQQSEKVAQQFEKKLILKTLKSTHGNITKAAGKLGITRASLHNKINQMDIDISLFK